MKRRESRESSLKILFGLDFDPKPLEELKLDLISLFDEESIKDFFTWELVSLVLDHKKEIDTVLTKNLKNWSMNRLSVVDKNILRLGTAEILYSSTEKAVIINEYIEISKIYGTQESAGFINGILDSILRHNEN